MTGVAKRLARDVFTKKLAKMCARLDEASARSIAYKDLFKNPQPSRIEVVALWVVGSYARGALLCGDLDVVFEVTSLIRFASGAAPSATGAWRSHQSRE
jgi:UTP:GlnB (protein PII) uridylyltransferase